MDTRAEHHWAWPYDYYSLIFGLLGGTSFSEHIFYALLMIGNNH